MLSMGDDDSENGQSPLSPSHSLLMLTLSLHGKSIMCHGSSGLERGGKGCFISNRPLFVSGPIRACCGLIFLWKCLRWF